MKTMDRKGFAIILKPVGILQILRDLKKSRRGGGR